MIIKQIFIFLLIFCISPSEVHILFNDSSGSEKNQLLSDIELESEEKDTKEDTKKENEKQKCVSPFYLNLNLIYVLGRLYIVSAKSYPSPVRPISSPPPDFI